MASMNDYYYSANPMAGFGSPTITSMSQWGMPSAASPNYLNSPYVPSPYVPAPIATPVAAAAPAADSMWGSLGKWARDSGMLTTKDETTGLQTQGWGGLALGAAQGIGNLYLGMQQYNLAKDALANSKSQFERNFAAQKSTTNAQLEDRQRARVASNAGAYQSVGDYMAQNGVR